MSIAPSLVRIMDMLAENLAPTKEGCCPLLSFHEQSLEAHVLTVTADNISRRRFHNHAVLLGQIGIETAPCSGDCKFCAFAYGNSILQPGRLTVEQIVARARTFCEGKDVGMEDGYLKMNLN